MGFRLDPNSAIPLIRQNPVGGVGPPYRFADPVDLYQPSSPSAEYGFLQSSSTQRRLFRSPEVESGQNAVTSLAPFLLADVYSLAGGVSLFPREDLGIPMPINCSLQTPAPAQLRRVIPPQGGAPTGSFIVGSPAERIVTHVNSSLTVHAVYGAENAAKTVVTWMSDSIADPDWSFSMGPVSVLGDLGSFPGLLRVVGTLESQSGGAPQLSHPRLLFGGAPLRVRRRLPFLQPTPEPAPPSAALAAGRDPCRGAVRGPIRSNRNSTRSWNRKSGPGQDPARPLLPWILLVGAEVAVEVRLAGEGSGFFWIAEPVPCAVTCRSSPGNWDGRLGSSARHR